MTPWGTQRSLKFFDGSLHARLQVQRMKPVEKKEAADQRVVGQSVDGSRARVAGGYDLHGAFQSGAMKIHDRLNQLLRCGS